MIPQKGVIWIITGPREVGKTRFCMELLKRGRSKGVKVAGILSPAGFENGVKQTINIENAQTSEQKVLATLRKDENTGILTNRWAFDADALLWGSKILADALPCDLFFIDELGLLEFSRGEGWQEGLKALDSRKFTTAVIVIRPELLTVAASRWKDAKVLEIPPNMSFQVTQDFVDWIVGKSSARLSDT
jgi:nucleoside-triphosphatase THEP1